MTITLHTQEGPYSLDIGDIRPGLPIRMFDRKLDRSVVYYPVRIAYNYQPGPYRPDPVWGPNGVESPITAVWEEYFHEEMVTYVPGEGRWVVLPEFQDRIEKARPPFKGTGFRGRPYKRSTRG